MNQALYAHMNNKRKKNKSPYILKKKCVTFHGKGNCANVIKLKALG
jgi:hypothetical protein